MCFLFRTILDYRNLACVSNSSPVDFDSNSWQVVVSHVLEISGLSPTELVRLLFEKNDSRVLDFFGGPDILIKPPVGFILSLSVRQ